MPYLYIYYALSEARMATAAVPPHPSDRTDTETTATDTIINNTLFILPVLLP